MLTIAERVKGISPSPTLALEAKAKEMIKAGLNVISFGVGEPDFDTPEYIKQSAIESINKGFTKYTPASGIEELKDAITKKLKNDNNLDYEKSQIIVSCGAKHSLYNIFQAIINEEDEVIVPIPYWVTYPEQVKLAGGKPIFVDSDEKDGFRIKADKLKSYITPKTKAFILNSPSNPTGAVYTEEEIRKLAEIFKNLDVYIISDEVYEKLVFDGAKHFSIATIGGMKEKTFVVNALSKTYSMTGWRLGYLAGPKDVVKAMSNLQSHSTSNPTSFVQKAGVVAMSSSYAEVDKMVLEFDKRRKYIVERLNKIKNISCITPEGAFYAFPNITKTGLTSSEFANRLLNDEKVVVVPGSDFGKEGFLRLSYATSMAKIEEGLNRIERFVSKL
jgi:aspartate aminotransferase